MLPGVGDKSVGIGDAVRLIRPDASVIESTINGIVFNEAQHVFVAKLKKQDVPVGTEVWLTS